MNDAWNMLYSEGKLECDMIKEDSQKNSPASNEPQNIMAVSMAFSLHITVWSFGYKKLSLPPHAIRRSLWWKAPQFSSVIYAQIPVWDTQSSTARYLSKSFWQMGMNISQQATGGEASQVRNPCFSSTITRPSFMCKLSRFLLHATHTKALSRS